MEPLAPDMTGDEVILRSVPELTFIVDAEGRLWNVTYNLYRGSIAAQPVDSGPQHVSVRRFLTGLHLAHGFPEDINARWFWAVAVDAMFLAIVFWALSGILMWWQIRAVRRWGFVTLVVGGIAFIALAIGMSV